MEGYIKLYRQIWNNPVVTKDAEYFVVWIYILTHATHKRYKTLFDNKEIELHPGQLKTGRNEISLKTNIDSSKVYRILNKLNSEHLIEQQKSSKGTLITITNWEQYQKSEHQNEQQVNNEWTTSEHQVNTNNNVNNIKNNNNVIINSYNYSKNKTEILIYYSENFLQRIIVPEEIKTICEWIDIYGSNFVQVSMRRAIMNGKFTLAYIEGIINNWVAQYVKTNETTDEEEIVSDIDWSILDYNWLDDKWERKEELN